LEEEKEKGMQYRRRKSYLRVCLCVGVRRGSKDVWLTGVTWKKRGK